MLARRWLSHPAIGVGIVVVALLLIAGLQNHYRAASGEQRAAAVENQQPHLPAQSCDADCEARRAEQRAKDDLEAQQEMAWWAFWLFVVSLTGVGLLGATLYETRRAGKAAVDILAQTRRQADSAEQAAVAAGEAAKDAKRQADIAEDSYRRLERPYLFVKFMSTGGLRRPGASRPFLRYTLVNYGKTPAILRLISVGLMNNPSYPLRTTMAIAEHFYDVIPPGEALSKVEGRRLEVVDSKVGEQFDGQNATLLILHGIIHYEDPTGAYHVDSFCMRANAGGNSFTIDGGAEYNRRRSYRPGEPYDPNDD